MSTVGVIQYDFLKPGSLYYGSYSGSYVYYEELDDMLQKLTNCYYRTPPNHCTNRLVTYTGLKLKVIPYALSDFYFFRNFILIGKKFNRQESVENTFLQFVNPFTPSIFTSAME